MSVNHIIENVQEQSQNNREQTGPKRPIVWSEARIFIAFPCGDVCELPAGADLKDQCGCLMVGIKKSDHIDFPIYRVAVGAIRGDGAFGPGFSPRTDIQQLRSGVISMDKSFETFERLLRAAEAWIQVDLGYEVDRYVLRKGGANESSKVLHARHARSPGKTERARARGKARPRRDS
jgi:hypothetical protein